MGSLTDMKDHLTLRHVINLINQLLVVNKFYLGLMLHNMLQQAK